MPKMKKMTPAEFLLEARRLRVESDESEAKFMAFLRYGEANEDLWRSTGVVSFDNFLKANHVCDPARYRAYCKTADELGAAKVVNIGLDAAVEAVKVPDPEKRQQAVRHMEEFRKEHGTTMSKQAAYNAVRQYHSPPTKEPRLVRRANRLEELETENAKLRKENKALLARIAELEALLEPVQAANVNAKTKSARPRKAA